MKRASLRRPSPALVISLLALFVALGGSAYAASKIGTKDIKANAITTGKIKKNAITTAKIKKEAVTGAKIKESSLGPVPNATNAVNATNATNWSRYYTSGVKKANLGETVTLGSAGPFTFIGKCVDLGGGKYESQAYVKTSQPKSMMSSYENDYSGFDFEPGEEAEIGYETESTTPYWEWDYYGYYWAWTAVSPDGSVVLRGNVNSGVHVFGSACAFNIEWTNAA